MLVMTSYRPTVDGRSRYFFKPLIPWSSALDHGISESVIIIGMEETAVLGTGCFWCSEAIFQRVKAVKSTKPGYAGGEVENPSYEQVCDSNTGHAEVVEVVFDPKVIKYEELLDIFWQIHDPTTMNRQGNDVGPQYRSIILYTTEEQKLKAEESRKKLEEANAFGKPIVTEVKVLSKFYPAESYHHNYFVKNPNQGYCRAIIAPKMEHFQKRFGEYLKS